MKIKSGIITLSVALAACFTMQASTSSLYLSSSTPSGFTPGPYSGTLNGTSVQLFCDDAIDTAPIGGTWQVDTTSIMNATMNTRYGEQLINDTSTSYFPAGTTQAQLPTGVVLYEQLAWLFTQLANTTPSSSYAAGIQTAAWDLTSTDGPANADAKVWIAAAQSDYNKTSGIPAVSVDGTTVSIIDPKFSNWLILTAPAAVNDPKGGSGNQEFLAYYSSTGPGGFGQPSPTPEPKTYLLFGSGLLAVGMFSRRKRRPA